jgi:hypothetical protein
MVAQMKTLTDIFTGLLGAFIAVTVSGSAIGNANAGQAGTFHASVYKPVVRGTAAAGLHHAGRPAPGFNRATRRQHLETRARIRQLSRDTDARWAEHRLRSDGSSRDVEHYRRYWQSDETLDGLRQNQDQRNLDQRFGRRAPFLSDREIRQRTAHQRERVQRKQSLSRKLDGLGRAVAASGRGEVN